jgi:hypothetical protein
LPIKESRRLSGGIQMYIDHIHGIKFPKRTKLLIPVRAQARLIMLASNSPNKYQLSETAELSSIPTVQRSAVLLSVIVIVL